MSQQWSWHEVSDFENLYKKSQNRDTLKPCGLKFWFFTHFSEPVSWFWLLIHSELSSGDLEIQWAKKMYFIFRGMGQLGPPLMGTTMSMMMAGVMLFNIIISSTVDAAAMMTAPQRWENFMRIQVEVESPLSGVRCKMEIFSMSTCLSPMKMSVSIFSSPFDHNAIGIPCYSLHSRKKWDPGILDSSRFSAQFRKVEARSGMLAKIRKIETNWESSSKSLGKLDVGPKKQKRSSPNIGCKIRKVEPN